MKRMSVKKFELTNEYITWCGRKLFRIKALIDFGNVKAGELGGYVKKEENLSHDGDAYVYDNADYTTIKGFGSCSRTTTFFRGKDEKIYVRCGCFYGDIESFRKKIKETHGDSKYAKEYLMIADLMEMHFGKEDK